MKPELRTQQNLLLPLINCKHVLKPAVVFVKVDSAKTNVESASMRCFSNSYFAKPYKVHLTVASTIRATTDSLKIVKMGVSAKIRDEL